jgi:hypothetical protein
MYSYQLHHNKYLGFLAFWTLQASCAYGSVELGASTCSGDACGATGTVLLKINSSTKRISWAQPDNDNHEDAAKGTRSDTLEEAAKAPLALQETVNMQGSRLQSLSDLEYDSDNDDRYHGIDESDLNLIDDAEYSAKDMDWYVSGTGYSENTDASFAPDVWNTGEEIRSSHNCYMYALNDLSPRSYTRCQRTMKLVEEGQLNPSQKERPKMCRRFFHKPGYYFQNFVSGRAQTDTWFRDETSCRLMLPMLAADSPNIVWNNDHNASLKEDDACPESHYMAALFIQPKAGFHFYRRDHACKDEPEKLCWSHKPGIMKATDKDASGNKIKSVLAADRNYGELNYHEHCAFFCVPENSHLRTHSDSKRSASATTEHN